MYSAVIPTVELAREECGQWLSLILALESGYSSL